MVERQMHGAGGLEATGLMPPPSYGGLCVIGGAGNIKTRCGNPFCGVLFIVVSSSWNMDEDDPPDGAECPLTLELMVDPVVCADGHTYERFAIEM